MHTCTHLYTLAHIILYVYAYTCTGSTFLISSVQRIQAFMSRFMFETPNQDRTVAYLQELLNPRGDKSTLESQKIREYVGVCLANMDTPTDTGMCK